MVRFAFSTLLVLGMSLFGTGAFAGTISTFDDASRNNWHDDAFGTVNATQLNPSTIQFTVTLADGFTFDPGHDNVALGFTVDKQVIAYDVTSGYGSDVNSAGHGKYDVEITAPTSGNQELTTMTFQVMAVHGDLDLSDLVPNDDYFFSSVTNHNFHSPQDGTITSSQLDCSGIDGGNNGQPTDAPEPMSLLVLATAICGLAGIRGFSRGGSFSRQAA